MLLMKPETLDKLGLYIKENRKGTCDFLYFYIDPRNSEKISYNCGELMSNIVLSSNQYDSIGEGTFETKPVFFQKKGFQHVNDSYIEMQVKKLSKPFGEKHNGNKLIDWLKR